MGEFYVIGGPVKHDAPSYVQRNADAELYDHLRRGEYCHVLTPRQMGKTSLVGLTKARLKNDGVTVAILDLQQSGQNTTVEQWYRGLVKQIGVELDLDDELGDYWREHRDLGPLQRFTHAIRDVVLTQYQSPVVLFIDEVDYLLSLDFSTDEFLAGLRGFYNRRNEDPQLARLTICLLGVLTPSDLIRDPRTTPFNIGHHIELADFTDEEAAPLADGLNQNKALSRDLLARILYWTGGQPYLTQRLCKAVAEDPDVAGVSDVDRLCRKLFISSDAEEQDNHLAFVSRPFVRKENLGRSDRSEILSEADRVSLLNLYDQILRYRGVRDKHSTPWRGLTLGLYGALRAIRPVRDDDTNPLVSTLQLSGITRVAGGYLYVRNRIYQYVFNHAWVQSHLPGEAIRQQREAFFRGARRVAAIAAVILALMGYLTISAVRARNIADHARSVADQLKGERDAKIKELDETNKKLMVSIAEAEKAKADALEKQREASENADKARRQQKIAEDNYAQLLAKESEIKDLHAKNEKDAADKASKDNPYLAYLKYAESLKYKDDQDTRMRLFEMREKVDLMGRESWEWPKKDDASGGKAGYVIKFSQDGSLLSAGSRDGMVRVWNADSGDLVFNLNKETAAISSVAFSLNNRYLVSGSADGSLKLWELKDKGKEIRTFKAHSGPVTCVAFSPDGGKIVSGGTDGKVVIWSINGEMLDNLSFGEKSLSLSAGAVNDSSVVDRLTTPINYSPVLGVSYSANGQKIFAVLKENNDHISFFDWDLNGKEVNRLNKLKTIEFDPEHFEYVLNSISELLRLVMDDFASLGSLENSRIKLTDILAFSPERRQFIIRESEGEVLVSSLAQLDSPGLVKVDHLKLQEEKHKITVAAFNGAKLAAIREDGSLKLWDISGRNTPVLPGPVGGVNVLTLSTDNKFLAAGDKDNKVWLWSVKNKQLLKVMEGHTRLISALAFDPAGRRLASSGLDQTVKVWNPTSGKEMLTLPGPVGDKANLKFSPDGKYLAASSGSDGSVRVWDLSKEKPETKTLGYNYVTIADLAYSPDGMRIAIAGWDTNVIRFYDTNTQHFVKTLGGSESPILGIAFNNFNVADRRLASRHVDGTVLLWDIDTRRIIRKIPAHSGAVRAVAFSPNGETIATASDKEIAFWESATGKKLFELHGHESQVNSVAFRPDGKRLVSASDDKTVRLWDIEARKELLVLHGHTEAVNAAAFSPDGKWLASVGRDKTVRLWNEVKGEAYRILSGHEADVRYLSFSADGRRLATGGEDTFSILWDLEEKLAPVKMNGFAPVRGLSLGRNNRYLATGDEAGRMILWKFGEDSMGDAVSLNEYNINAKKGTNDIAFSPTGNWLAAGNKDGTVKIWDSVTGRELHTIKGDRTEISRIIVGSDGRSLTGVSDSGRSVTWEIEIRGDALTARPSQTTHNDGPKPASSPKWTADFSNRTITLENSESRKKISLPGREANIDSFTLFEDAEDSHSWLASAGDDRMIHLLNIQSIVEFTDKPLDKLLEDAKPLHSGYIDSRYNERRAKWEEEPRVPVPIPTENDKDDQSQSLAGLLDRYRRGNNSIATRLAIKRELRPIEGQLAAFIDSAGGITSTAITADGARILTGNSAGVATLLDTVSGKTILSFDHFREEGIEHDQREKGSLAAPDESVTESAKITAVDFSPDGRRLLTASDNGTAIIRPAQPGAGDIVILHHGSAITHAAFSHDGRHLVTTSADMTARIWNAQGGALIATLNHNQIVETAQFSPDGKLVATVAADHKIRLWEIGTQRALSTLAGHSKDVNSLAFSPDGRIIVTAGDDGIAQIWDVNTGAPVVALAHAGAVNSAEFNSDGSRVLTASDDKTAKVWNLSGELLLTLYDHSTSVKKAFFASNGRRIITLSDDGNISVWQTDNGAWVSTYQHNPAGDPDIGGKPFSIAYSNGSNRLLSAYGRSLKLWDTEAAAGSIPLRGRLLTGRFPAHEAPATEYSHLGRIESFALSPDGRKFVTASWDKTAKVWDITAEKPPLSLEGHTDRVYDVSYSPNGKYIVTASPDKTAKIWDAETGKLLHNLDKQEGRARNAKFSPDGMHVVVTGRDKAARVYDVAGGKLLFSLEGHSDAIRNFAFNKDGSRIVTLGGRKDKTAKLWAMPSGELLRTLEGHRDEIVAAAFSHDGRKIVTGSSDYTARIWEAESGKLIAEVKHANKIRDCQFSPDDRRVLTASEDKTAKVWDADNGNQVLDLKDHDGVVIRASFSNDGKRIVTTSGDGIVRLWDAVHGNLLANYAAHGRGLVIADFDLDDRYIITAGGDRVAKRWAAAAGPQPASANGHKAGITAVAIAGNGTKVVTASADKTVKVWNILDGKQIASFGHTSKVISVAADVSGSQVLTAVEDRKARIWDATTGLERLSFDPPSNNHSDNIWGVGFSNNGKRIVTYSNDKTARIWDAASGQFIVSLKGHTESVGSAVFSPDDTRILTISADDNSVRLWDSATGRQIAMEIVQFDRSAGGRTSALFSRDGSKILAMGSGLRVVIMDASNLKIIHGQIEHDSWINSADFSKDGRLVVTTGADRTAKIWETTSGKLVATLAGHQDDIYWADFSPDGKKVVTASQDTTAKVWDTSNGTLLHTLAGHGAGLNEAKFSPDGKFIVTGSFDQTIKIWDATSYAELMSLQHSGLADHLTFSLDGSLLAVGGRQSGSISIWETKTWTKLKGIEGPGKEVRGIAFSPDGHRLATAVRDDAVRIWDVNTGRQIAAIGSDYPVTVSFVQGGARLVTANKNGSAILWDVTNRRELARFNGRGAHNEPVSAAALSLDGSRVATASQDKTVKLWNAASGALINTLKGHTQSVTSLSFSPDGKHIVSGDGGTDNGIAIVWNLITGKSFKLEGHTGALTSAAFSPDGKLVATGSKDKTAMVWDALTGKLILTLAGHNEAVSSVQFTPDGKSLLTGSDDKTTRLWDLTLETRSPEEITGQINRLLPWMERKRER